jgi:hypothetical protein
MDIWNNYVQQDSDKELQFGEGEIQDSMGSIMDQIGGDS